MRTSQIPNIQCWIILFLFYLSLFFYFFILDKETWRQCCHCGQADMLFDDLKSCGFTIIVCHEVWRQTLSSPSPHIFWHWLQTKETLSLLTEVQHVMQETGLCSYGIWCDQMCQFTNPRRKLTTVKHFTSRSPGSGEPRSHCIQMIKTVTCSYTFKVFILIA